MARYTAILNPDDIEARLAQAIGDGPPLGRYHEAWHLTQPNGLPALLLVRHEIVTMDALHRLCHLLLRAGIAHGYLASVTAQFSTEMIQSAAIVGVTLLDNAAVESFLRAEIERIEYER